MVGSTVVNLMYTEDCILNNVTDQLNWSAAAPYRVFAQLCMTHNIYDTQCNDVKSVTTLSNTNEEKQIDH